LKLFEEKLGGRIILVLFANFEARAHKTAQKTKNIFLANVNQKKLYIPFLVSDQQVVQNVLPFHIAGYHAHNKDSLSCCYLPRIYKNG
jgi:hypothetical protein